jgi:hypothetical protein
MIAVETVPTLCSPQGETLMGVCYIPRQVTEDRYKRSI